MPNGSRGEADGIPFGFHSEKTRIPRLAYTRASRGPGPLPTTTRDRPPSYPWSRLALRQAESDCKRLSSRACPWSCCTGTGKETGVLLMPTEAMARKLARGAAARRDLEDAQHRREVEAKRSRGLTDPHPSKGPSPEGLVAWEAIQARMRGVLDESTWRLWGMPVHPHRRPSAHGGAWVLACPASCHGWVVERFGRAWEWACQAPVRFVICDQSTSERSPV
jgi:hypothetical protein